VHFVGLFFSSIMKNSRSKNQNNRNIFNCFEFPVFQVTGVPQAARVKTREPKCLTFIIC